ncbi:9190_t:CDS:2 [Funneliformis geosporum]|uniref:9190_t:CDS:1 n=1 Tax=Funneliformis geosporum TaxID=1117311 RepID=A0A9W4SHJ3_9GLOM|nr:9190_t:CDS:2 [Funneliformis geosporum]
MLRLEDCDTRKFDFQNFNVKKHFLIGSGAFASVYYAYWKGTQTKFAIKKFAEGSTKEIILNEIRCMKLVNYHPNIIGFCGVTRFEDDTSIQFEILKGVREIPIPTTNGRFVKLYQKCCQHEPNERPEINQVISELNSISHSEESVRIEELGNDECLRTEELKNEETKKSVVGCDLATYDKI